MSIYQPIEITDKIRQEFRPTRLYIKKLDEILYFGKTIVEDVTKYHGSGIAWSRLVAKRGSDQVLTLWISDYYYDPEEIQQVALNFSEENQIVESARWANLKPENGIDGGWPTNMATFVNEHGITFYLKTDAEEIFNNDLVHVLLNRKRDLIPCKFCHEEFGNVWAHEPYCEKNPNRVSGHRAGISHNYSFVECRFCHNEYKENALEWHMRFCDDNPDRETMVRKSPEFSYVNCQYCNKVICKHQLSRHEDQCLDNPNRQDPSTKGKKYDKEPCRFCDRKIASNGLSHHEETCRENPNRVPGRGFGQKKKTKECCVCGRQIGVNGHARHERTCGK